MRQPHDLLDKRHAFSQIHVLHAFPFFISLLPPTDVKRRVTHKQMSERLRALPHQLEEPPIELLPTPSLQMADVGREPGVGTVYFPVSGDS